MIDNINYIFCSLSKCNDFGRTIEIQRKIQFILIECKAHWLENGKNHNKLIYSNAHALIQKTKFTKETLNSSQNLDSKEEKPLNILMIGIDSISRLNLIRAMPKTTNFLESNAWYELRGYNKVAVNSLLGDFNILMFCFHHRSMTILIQI
jgi:hypothetical protein